MNVVKLAIAALLFLSTAAQADFDLSLGDNGFVKNVPSCSFRGKPVVLFPTTSHYLASFHVTGAMARMDVRHGGPAIFYDYAKLKDKDPSFQYWVLAHECAHWELGHPAVPLGYGHSGVEYEERDADCRAGKNIIKAGFSEQQALDLLDLITEDQREFLPPNAKQDPTSRSKHIRSCMQEQISYGGR